MNGSHNDIRGRSNKRHGNRGTEDIMDRSNKRHGNRVTDGG